jgi:phosphoketolase
MGGKLDAHDGYIRRFGQDLPEVREWKWQKAA